MVLDVWWSGRGRGLGYGRGRAMEVQGLPLFFFFLEGEGVNGRDGGAVRVFFCGLGDSVGRGGRLLVAGKPNSEG